MSESTSSPLGSVCHLVLVLPVLHLGSKNTKEDSLPHVHPANYPDPDPETTLPSACFIQAITWDFDQEIANTLLYHVPAACSLVTPMCLQDSKDDSELMHKQHLPWVT